MAILLANPVFAQVCDGSAEGQSIYNADFGVPQYCDGTDWRAMGPLASGPFAPPGCESIGDVCADGAVNAGQHSQGHWLMVQRCDVGQSWDGSACTGSRSNLQWRTTTTDTPNTQNWDFGNLNTAAIETAGLALHPAAQACRDIGNEWYLPAMSEVSQISTNRNAGALNGTFLADARYWSSYSYASSTTAWRFRITNPWQDIASKTTSHVVRCARRVLPPLTNVVQAGLVGHWKLEETGNFQTRLDSSMNGHGGGNFNGHNPLNATTDGVIGRAMTFDGSGEHTGANSTAKLSPTGDWTLTGWFRIDGTTGDDSQQIISKYETPTSSNYEMDFNQPEQTLRCGYAGAGGYVRAEDAARPLELNKWYHGACVYEGGTLRTFVNGVLFAEETSGVIPATNTSTLRFGYKDWSTDPNSLFGTLDDIRIYERALSVDEIDELVRATPGRIVYDQDRSVPTYFDGDDWQAMGPPKPTTTGLVGWWRLDEASGSFVDSSGYGNDGTQNGGVSYASAGVIGNAVRFDGVDDTINIPHSDALNIVGDQLTLSAWVYAESLTANGRKIICRGDCTIANGAHYRLDIYDDRVRFGIKVGGSAFFTDYMTSFPLNEWHLITGTYDGQFRKLYVDGVEVASAARTGNLSSQNTPLHIGSSDGTAEATRVWDGRIDDVRIYNRALSPAEISEFYATAFSPCDTIGEVCADGSVYAGLSPDGNVPMYTTPADAGQFSWNDGSINSFDTAMQNCITGTPGAEGSCQTGEANTALLVGLGTTPTPAPYVAARHCDDLIAHGKDDWYLPAQDELNVMRTNRVAIGGFNLSGLNPAGRYWSSSERQFNGAKYQTFSDGNQTSFTKHSEYSVRCVRKQPSIVMNPPSCSNPSRGAGTILYNTDMNIMQYCNGISWIKIGP